MPKNLLYIYVQGLLTAINMPAEQQDRDRDLHCFDLRPKLFLVMIRDPNSVIIIFRNLIYGLFVLFKRYEKSIAIMIYNPLKWIQEFLF
jgi:hypothetical protein